MDKKSPSSRVTGSGNVLTPGLTPEQPSPRQQRHSGGLWANSDRDHGKRTPKRSQSFGGQALERLGLDGGHDPYRFTVYDYVRLKLDMLSNHQFDDRFKEVAGSVRKVLHSVIYDLFMLLVTLFILTADVIRYVLMEKEHDWWMLALIACAIIFFSVDIGLRYFCEERYCNSYLCWMDAFSMLAMIWDITVHMLSEEAWKTGTNYDYIMVGESIRVVCLLRIARMARIVTLVDQCSLSCKRMVVKSSKRRQSILPVSTSQQEGQTSGEPLQPQKAEQLNRERSRVSNEFIEMTVRKVIAVIVLLCLFFPLLEPSRIIYSKLLPRSHREGLAHVSHVSDFLYSKGQPTPSELLVLKASLQDYAHVAGHDLLWLKLSHVPQNTTNSWLQEANVTSLLSMSEIQSKYRELESPTIRIGHTTAFFNAKRRVGHFALTNLALRFFALVLIVACGVIFQYAQSAVTVPIERMTVMVQNLAENPLAKLEGRRSTMDRGGGHFVMSPIRARMRRQPSEAKGGGGADKEETALLENVLMKISQLLQIGFGTAGAELIAKNMRGGAENALGNGKKVTCVFAFVKIDDFTSICSGLEEDVCTYINTIAYIVHRGVVQWNGAPNKNTGSAFFCVWKLPDDRTCDTSQEADAPQLKQLVKFLREKKAKEEVGRQSSSKKRKLNLKQQILAVAQRAQQLTPIADNAVLSLIAIRCELQYAEVNTAFDRFKDQRGGQIGVKLGFGLHVGWAIEGALGSLSKIDATYLSPNVNLASRLEAATHQFGCPMLMSGELVAYLSPKYKDFCRMIDCVKAKGSDQPMELWTFDISDYPTQPNFLTTTDREIGGSIMAKLRSLQRSLSSEFKHFFAIGIDSYITGEWKKAKDFLMKALEAKPHDGPSKCIIRVLEKRDCQAPPGWSGCRALTEK